MSHTAGKFKMEAISCSCRVHFTIPKFSFTHSRYICFHKFLTVPKRE